MHKIRRMLRIILMLLLVVFWTMPAFAQNTLWTRTYGGSSHDGGFSVQQTTDGGYIVAGSTTFGAGGSDVYLIKADSLGDTLWTRTYGGSGYEEGWSVQQTTDGGYIVAGYTNSFGAGFDDVYLIKTDSSGDTVWSRTYGGSDTDYGWSVQQTTDGGYIVTGTTYSFGAGGLVYLIKTDANGDTLWSRTYGDIDSDFSESVQQTTDRGYIVAGYTLSFGAGNWDVCLIKTDSLGDTLWTRTYGGSSHDGGFSVQQTTDGGYIVAGLTMSFGASGYEDVFLIKTDSNGGALWSRTYGYGGEGSNDRGYSVQQTTDGGYIVTGYTESFGAGWDLHVFLIKTNSNGDTLWTRTFGGSEYDCAWSVQQTTDGGYIVTGYTESFGAGQGNVILTKLDSLGNTCIGEFVSPTVMSVACSLTSPATVVTSPPTIVTDTTETVTSPATEVTTVCMRVCGDVTGDGVVDLGDVLYLISYLYKGGSAPDPLEAGDVNCDGIIELGDLLYLISYLYKGGPPPCC